MTDPETPLLDPDVSENSPEFGFVGPSMAAHTRQSNDRSRRRTWIVLSVIVLTLVPVGVLWAMQSSPAVPPTAARVTMRVGGMHCPIQCPTRVGAALDSIPWVVPDSTRVNVREGRVWFMVTDPAAIDPEAVRQALQSRGFGAGEMVPVQEGE